MSSEMHDQAETDPRAQCSFEVADERRTAPASPSAPAAGASAKPAAEHARWKRCWYFFLRCIVRVIAISIFRSRSFGQQHVPPRGAVLLLANHQSHLDPILVGMCCRRQLNYLARRTLFDIAGLNWLIRSLNAIPIDRDGSGLGGLKETMRRLKRGEIVLLFPEGTRTRDGEVQPLKSGFCTLARRSPVTLVPVAIEGAFASWPRGAKFPLPGSVTLVFGQPLSPQRVAAIADDAELVAEVERELRRCHAEARAQIERGKNG